MSIMIDIPWGQVVPKSLYVVMMSLETLLSKYNLNPAYFHHGNYPRFILHLKGILFTIK